MSDVNSLPNKTTQDHFLAALFSIMEHKDYQDISIVDICKEANMSRKTFYNYFKQKDDLLDYLAQIICLCYSKTDDHTGHYHYFEFFYHMQNSVQLLLNNGLWYDVAQRTLSQYKDLLYPRDWKVTLGNQIEKKEWFLEFMSYGSARLVELWCQNGFKESPKELSDLVDKIQSSSLIHT